MKERQRWQPEEDALLRAYVKQYGPKEWNLVSQRMAKPLDRDAKSCLERWKNYLKPGIKKGSLTPEEQSLVISLQAKYGNKWKKIAAEVPGRTAKRLGKWWEVFKEKQIKQNNKTHQQRLFTLDSSANSSIPSPSSAPLTVSPTTTLLAASPEQGKYDHILETFAEKYVQPKLQLLPSLLMPNLSLSDAPPMLSLCGGATTTSSPSMLLPWMTVNSSSTSSLSSSSSTTASPSVSLSLSQTDLTKVDLIPPEIGLNEKRHLPVHQLATLVHYCKELEEGRQSWLQHKKEAMWRLNRLEQQLESEKNRKKRETMEEVEAKIRCLREEEMGFLDRIDRDCREQLNAIYRDAEAKEAKMVEIWSRKHVKLAKLVEQQLGSIYSSSSLHHHHHHHHHHS
ncbi:protein rough sheath 2 homolog [Telopea speciosissima]|uniref:protein rough sheath 2 homolog n=1 Tax=Telopea speciosissima TaxID=54955 RepID=UPI001CC36AC4|nr:protein rough sheath 2 homolog [Telopea speciosissima]